MDQIPDHPVYSKNVLEMVTVANDFCMTLKRVETIEKKKLLEYLAKVSPLLYLKGALLPEVKVKNPDMNERFYTEEEWEILFNTLRKILGGGDIFWYAEKEISDDLIKGSLSEHLTDVFQDLQDFLLLYQVNKPLRKALGPTWKFYLCNIISIPSSSIISCIH